MLIGEAAKEAGTTKKAIEYYEEQGLINPEISGNGYRSFSPEDVTKLRKISVLRSLGLSATEIKEFLSDKKYDKIQKIIDRKAFETETLKTKEKLLKELSEKEDWDKIWEEVRTLERKTSVLTRLLNCFPGFYGQYLTVHFAPFLNDPITTPEQQKAFDTAVSFLDNLKIDIPDDLSKFIYEITKEMDMNFAEKISKNLQETVENPKKYLHENRENIELYRQMKESEEYKNSPAFRLYEFLKKISSENGYYDIFIPAIKILSPSYKAYCEKLMEADRIFSEEFKS